MSVDDEPGAPSTAFTAADIPFDDSLTGEEGANIQLFLVALDTAIGAISSFPGQAVNVPLVDPELTDADTAVNAVIAALISGGLMEEPA